MAGYGATVVERLRAERLVDAERERVAGTQDADVEYAETVAKLRERYEADLAEALTRRLAAVRPTHQACNAATVRAERAFAEEQSRRRS